MDKTHDFSVADYLCCSLTIRSPDVGMRGIMTQFSEEIREIVARTALRNGEAPATVQEQQASRADGGYRGANGVDQWGELSGQGGARADGVRAEPPSSATRPVSATHPRKSAVACRKSLHALSLTDWTVALLSVRAPHLLSGGTEQAAVPHLLVHDLLPRRRANRRTLLRAVFWTRRPEEEA